MQLLLDREAAAAASLQAAQDVHLDAMRTAARRLWRQPTQPLAQLSRRHRQGLPEFLDQCPFFQRVLHAFVMLGGVRYLGSCVPEYMLVRAWHALSLTLQNQRGMCRVLHANVAPLRQSWHCAHMWLTACVAMPCTCHSCLAGAADGGWALHLHHGQGA